MLRYRIGSLQGACVASSLGRRSGRGELADIPKRLSAVYVGMSRVEMVEAGEAAMSLP